MVVTIGISYAFITQTLTGTKKQVINAGVLDLVLEEENEITINDALTLYNECCIKIKRNISDGINQTVDSTVELTV